MNKPPKHIGILLKKARKERGLSQRDLSLRSGVPQSHISRIESGLVDLQTSSLVQLSRTLELELMLVPVRLVPTVRALERGKLGMQRPKYRLEEEVDDEE